MKVSPGRLFGLWKQVHSEISPAVVSSDTIVRLASHGLGTGEFAIIIVRPCSAAALTILIACFLVLPALIMLLAPPACLYYNLGNTQANDPTTAIALAKVAIRRAAVAPKIGQAAAPQNGIGSPLPRFTNRVHQGS